MSLNLKVVTPAQGSTKVMRFAEQMSVHEACKQIFEKVGVGGKDHGLFQPTNGVEESSGRWLKAEKTLEFYDLKTNDTVEYKKKHDTIKIKLVDDSIKTVLVDLSAPVSDIVKVIGEKISLKNADEFSLQSELKQGLWLKPQTSLPEQVSTMDQTFLLRKKFFVNDANLDQDDPVQLHLVYCQSRDDIVSGAHPVVKDEAIQFASLQCQIQYNDFKPDVHKPGYLNLAEILAPVYQKKDIEKIVLLEWKKLVGMSEVNARYRYVQLCRSLKTYGMTIFKVKERIPGKKKLMDAYLCFTRDSIIRMEAESKKIIKEHPFKHLMRWAASPETFTMDFGAYEESYVVVVTSDGEPISNLIAGYIDLLLKKQRDTGVVIDEEDGDIAQVSNVAKIGGLASTSMTSSNSQGSGQVSYAQGADDCAGGVKAIDRMVNDLFGEVSKMNDTSLTPEQRRQQIDQYARNLGALAETLENLAKTGDRSAMNAAAHKITAAMEQIILASRQAAAIGIDPDKILLNASKGVADALRNLLNAAANASTKPNDQQAKEALQRALQAASAHIQKLSAASKGTFADDGFQHLFRELAKAVNAECLELLRTAQRAEATVSDPNKRQQLQVASQSMKATDDNFAQICDILAPTAQDTQCKNIIFKAGKALEQTTAHLTGTAQMAGVDSQALAEFNQGQRRVLDALANVLGVTELPDMRGAKEADDFTEAAQALLQATSSVLASEGNPEALRQHSAAVKNAATRLGTAGKAIITATSDPAQRERIANYLKAVVEGTKRLLEAVNVVSQNPNDKVAGKKLKDAANDINEITNQLIADTGKQVALSALYASAKIAAATTTGLCTSARLANGRVTDNNTKEQLAQASANAAQAVQKLIAILKDTSVTTARRQTTTSFLKRASMINKDSIKDDIMAGAEQFAPIAYKLVSTAKTATPVVADEERKQDLVFNSNNAAKAIHKMLATRKALKAVKGQLETAEAMEQLKAAQTDLEGAIISAETGLLQPTKGKDEALADLAAAITELGNVGKQLATAAKSAPEELGNVMKQVAEASVKAVAAATAVAATLDDKVTQKVLLNSLKGVLSELKSLMQISKAVVANPDDPNLNKLLVDATKAVAEALVRLTDASKGVMPKKIEDFNQKAQSDMEDLAEQELRGAAAVIEKCVAKLTAATEAARQRATEKGIDLDEQNITEAILEAAQAIAKSTAALVNAATGVQQELNKLMKEPKSGNVYKRDPQWAQGLISAARTVAGAVQHLVKAANNAAQGNASEEALIVAAQAVSAATAQLVAASTVKADPNNPSQIKLREASTRVAQATSSLVNAAKAAAQWETEIQERDEDDKFNLHENKIREMEQQMAILRLEKELEKARTHLSTMRKNEYTGSATTLPNAPTGPTTTTEQRQLPTPNANNNNRPLKTSQVAWKSNQAANPTLRTNGQPQQTQATPGPKQTQSSPKQTTAQPKQTQQQPRPVNPQPVRQ